MPKYSVILPAAGSSSRFKDRYKKPFADLDGRAVWVRTAELFVNRDDVCQTIVVISADDREEFTRRFGANLAFMDVEVVEGGKERADSIARALERVHSDADYVAIHDAVRPCLLKGDVQKVFDAATRTGAAILATSIVDTLKRSASDGTIAETVSRQSLWAAQTPQVFARELILKAYANRSRLGNSVTDDAQLVEAVGGKVKLVEGPRSNIKITTKSDLSLAHAIIVAPPEPKPKQPLHPFAEDKMW